MRRTVAQADAETVRTRFLGHREFARLADMDGGRRLASTALLPDRRTVGSTRYDAERHAEITEVAVVINRGQ